MLTEYPDLQQGTEEWHALRRGMVTASVVGKLLTPTLKVATNDTSRGIVATLAAERIAGWTEETGMTSDMWRGVDSEPYARDIYSGHYQQAVECGFMVRLFDGFELGYSPDGLVGGDGLIEIKAPRAKTHIGNILAGGVPAHYYAQCQAGLLVSGRAWIDFVSFCGGLPLYVHRVEPDPEWHAAILAATRQAEDDITALVGAYRLRVAGLPVTERIPNYTTEPELKLA